MTADQIRRALERAERETRRQKMTSAAPVVYIRWTDVPTWARGR
jgi:hypothetical protein